MSQSVDTPTDPYGEAIAQGRDGLYLQPDNAPAVPLAVSRWCRPADHVDHSVLDRSVGPVLDVGCGPGRLTAALAAQGKPALGVDVAPEAISHALSLGAPALCQSVFEPLPAEGNWLTVLLIDGNVGIGGDPSFLLRRCLELCNSSGRILVEVEVDDTVDLAYTAHLFDNQGRRSGDFPWAQVGTGALLTHASTVGLRLLERWYIGPRVFCDLRL